jgi:hypothetical protein
MYLIEFDGETDRLNDPSWAELVDTQDDEKWNKTKFGIRSLSSGIKWPRTLKITTPEDQGILLIWYCEI